MTVQKTTREQRLETALQEIARQQLTHEMDHERAEHADYEGAYEAMIIIARGALL